MIDLINACTVLPLCWEVPSTSTLVSAPAATPAAPHPPSPHLPLPHLQAFHPACLGMSPDFVPNGQWLCGSCTLGMAGASPFRGFMRRTQPLATAPLDQPGLLGLTPSTGVKQSMFGYSPPLRARIASLMIEQGVAPGSAAKESVTQGASPAATMPPPSLLKVCRRSCKAWTSMMPCVCHSVMPVAVVVQPA